MTSLNEYIEAQKSDSALASAWEDGGLPLEMRFSSVSHEKLSRLAYHASLDENGIAVLPADWDDEVEPEVEAGAL